MNFAVPTGPHRIIITTLGAELARIHPSTTRPLLHPLTEDLPTVLAGMLMLAILVGILASGRTELGIVRLRLEGGSANNTINASHLAFSST